MEIPQRARLPLLGLVTTPSKVSVPLSKTASEPPCLSPSRHVEGTTKHQFQQEAKCSALQVGVKKKGEGVGKVVFCRPTDVFNHL